jgi:hypothetical protein
MTEENEIVSLQKIGTFTAPIALYEVWNKPELAEKWRAKLPKTEAKIE